MANIELNALGWLFIHHPPYSWALHQNKRDVRTLFCNDLFVTEKMSFLIGRVRIILAEAAAGSVIPPFFQKFCSLAPSNIDIQE